MVEIEISIMENVASRLNFVLALRSLLPDFSAISIYPTH
jgi:hypothetical protein